MMPPRLAGPQIVNAGIPGQNSSDGRARFGRDVLAVHPSVLLLYFGGNDALNPGAFVALDTYEANMAWMVDQALAHGIVPVVATVLHVDTDRLLAQHQTTAPGEAPNDLIDRYNRVLLSVARERQVAVADFAQALDAAGGPTLAMSTDGLHLTAAGNGLLARAFFQVMPLEIHRGVVCLGDSLTYGVPLRTPTQESKETYPAQLERLLLIRADG